MPSIHHQNTTMFNEKCLDTFYPTLAASTKVIKELEEQFGANASIIVSLMKAGKELPPEFMNAHDVLTDLVRNEAKIVGRTSRMGSEAGRYPIYVMAFEGVFFVTAPQFDDIGFFESKEEAETAIAMNWW